MTDSAMPGAAPSAEEAGLELAPRGMRFLEASTEAEYLAWQAVQSIPFNRSALAGSAALWVLQIGLFMFLRPVGFVPWIAPIAVIEVLCIMGVVGSRRPSASEWLQPFGAVANAIAGVVLVGILSLHFRVPQMSFGAAIAISFFAFAVFRMRPWQAAMAVSTYLVCQFALAYVSFRAGDLSRTVIVMQAIMLPGMFASGLQIGLVTDIALRQSFRLQRIVERQKEVISHERTRAEVVLKNEISHQVAERSRDLGVVLARSDVAFDARRLVPGERFDARYRIVQSLGAGGMGTVYEVERMTDGQQLALKAILGEVSGASAARFAREAEIGARLHHPNLVSIVDVGVSAGVPFLVMELMHGGSLEAQRARFGDPAWALPVLRQITHGVRALHEAGIVHRDLKPANVLLVRDGEPVVAKISDFGISRFGAEHESLVDPNAATIGERPSPRGQLTGTGVVMGTPLYMAPEAARGERGGAPTDVFALGLIAYEMLTGRAPFVVPAAILATSGQLLPSAPAIEDPRIPPALCALLRECLAAEASARPTIQRLATQLTATAD